MHITIGIKSVNCSTLQDANFEEHSLLAVALFDVLEQIEDDLCFLQMLSDQVIRTGHLLLTALAYSLLWSLKDGDAKHYRRNTLSSLSKIPIQASFGLEFATYIFPLFVLFHLRDSNFARSFGLTIISLTRDYS